MHETAQHTNKKKRIVSTFTLDSLYRPLRRHFHPHNCHRLWNRKDLVFWFSNLSSRIHYQTSPSKLVHRRRVRRSLSLPTKTRAVCTRNKK